jgi:hypothetical protein
MNYQHQWGQTEEAARARRSTGRRRQVAPALVKCPACGCGEYADTIAAGKCTGCRRAARKSN